MMLLTIILRILQYLSLLVGCILLPFAVVVDAIVDLLVRFSSARAVAWLHRHRCHVAIWCSCVGVGWCYCVISCPLNAGVCVCEHMRVPESGGVEAGLNALSSAHIVYIAVSSFRMAGTCLVIIVSRHPALFLVACVASVCLLV